MQCGILLCSVQHKVRKENNAALGELNRRPHARARRRRRARCLVYVCCTALPVIPLLDHDPCHSCRLQNRTMPCIAVGNGKVILPPELVSSWWWHAGTSNGADCHLNCGVHVGYWMLCSSLVQSSITAERQPLRAQLHKRVGKGMHPAPSRGGRRLLWCQKAMTCADAPASCHPLQCTIAPGQARRRSLK